MTVENVRIEKAGNGFILRYNEATGRAGSYGFDPEAERCFVYGNIAALLGAIEELYK